MLYICFSLLHFFKQNSFSLPGEADLQSTTFMCEQKKPALYRTATSPDSQMLSVRFYRILSGVCKFAAFTDVVTFPDGTFTLPGSQHPPFLIFHTTLGIMPKIDWVWPPLIYAMGRWSSYKVPRMLANTLFTTKPLEWILHFHFSSIKNNRIIIKYSWTGLVKICKVTICKQGQSTLVNTLLWGKRMDKPSNESSRWASTSRPWECFQWPLLQP